MRFFDLQRRNDNRERSVTLRTPWLTVVFDWGTTLCVQEKSDEPVFRRLWGPVFYFGWDAAGRLDRLRCFDCFLFSTLDAQSKKNERFWNGLRRDFKRKMREIDKGQRQHPAMMTPMERHQATAKVAQKLKWSKTFVEMMTTPMALRALESGSEAKSECGDRLCLGAGFFTHIDESGKVTTIRMDEKCLTREDFQRMRLEWKHEQVIEQLPAPEA
jgi:hypothetical protein